MKRQIGIPAPRRSPSSIAVSIALHGVVIAALATMTISSIPLAVLFGPRRATTDVPREQLQYVRTAARAPVGDPAAPARTTAPLPALGAPAAPLVAPGAVPTSIPAPVPGALPAGVPGGVAGGSAMDVARRDAVRGVEPGIPDPRLDVNAAPWAYTPMNGASKADSALAAIYGLYRDSVIARQLAAGRSPGDWTTTRNGQKWGWDEKAIRLGPISIPNAVLALIPLPLQGRNVNAITDGRMQAWTQQDLARAAQGMSQDEFKAAVKRIRERTDREKRDKQGATQPPTKKP